MFLQNSLIYILNSIHASQEFTDEYVNAKRQVEYFHEYTNRKKDGTLRRVYEPKKQEHAIIYKALYEELKKYQDLLHEAAHGFRIGRSNVTNAKKHLTANHLLNLDIEDFYGQIKTRDVEVVFTKLGANSEVASYLSKLCTIDGVLPQGLNTSPDIANHFLHPLDVLLSEYASKKTITYTRYVDDMSFSSAKQIEASEIYDIIKSQAIKLSTTKRKYQKRGANQYVTGLTIFDSNYPRVSKKYKKRLRLELFLISKFGINEFIIQLNKLPKRPTESDGLQEWIQTRDKWGTEKLDQLKGNIDYINGVEPKLATKMYLQFKQIIEARRRALELERDA